MTPSIATSLALALSVQLAETSTSAEFEKADLERYRLPYEQLVERAVGSVSRPVRFDWRKKSIHLGAVVAQPIEFNNFNSFRLGGLARFPTGDVLLSVGVGYVWTFGTEASDQLSLTPYLQSGRPSRFEVDFGVDVPVAEGIVTLWPAFFPALELVFSACVQLRYLFYPNSYDGIGVGDALLGALSPQLSDRELNNLLDDRLPGMGVDQQRYHLLAGFSTDIYLEAGLFIAPKVLFEVPIVAAITGSEMTSGLDVSLSLGVAF